MRQSGLRRRCWRRRELIAAAAVLRLLTDADLNARLRTAGRAWVEQHYAWQTVYRRVDAVYARLLDHAWHKARGAV